MLFTKKQKRADHDVELTNDNSNVPSTTPGKISLPYRIADHKSHWATWFFFFVFDGTVIPVVLFYALWYGSSISKWAVLAVVTSLSFWTSYHKWFSRGWRLLIKKAPTYRPLHSKRFEPDASYIILTLALGIMILELVIATATKDVKVSVIAMAPVSTLYVIAAYMFIQNTLYLFRVRLPFPISSVRKGERAPPALFTVMEDVFACDGCHEGLEARQAMLAMYEGNAAFRTTLVVWGWIWCAASLAVAIGLSIVVGLTPNTTSFGITYGVSWPFLVVMASITAWYMERQDAKGVFTVSSTPRTYPMIEA